MAKKNFILFIATVFCLLGVTGCLNQISKSSSSIPLSSFMSPVAESREVSRKVPLSLPASVAILFVPGADRNVIPYTTLYKASENLKKQLLKSPKYISSVSIIQADETKNKISLNEIKRSYAADMVIILTYQQDQRNSQSGVAGLMDATVVGAFVVPGVETNTTTLVDAKVIHIPNKALVLRISGMDERAKNGTSYSVETNQKDESINGLLAATDNLGDSLTKELSKFENYDITQATSIFSPAAENADDNQQGKDYWAKVDNYKSSGGGAFGFIPLLIALGICGLAWRRE